MTAEETLTMLELLRAAYPAFYRKATESEIESITLLWTEMFSDDDVNIVKFALKEIIAEHDGYPPDIATVKKKIKDITASVTYEQSDEELWQILDKALEHGCSNTQKEFDRLPKLLKRFCGDPSNLRKWSLMSERECEIYLRQRFMREIQILREREKYAETVPGAIKQALAIRTFNSLPGESNGKLVDHDYINSRRNEITKQLETKNTKEQSGQ